MLTDKQSILLCAFVVIGFVVAGMLDILDSYISIGILSLAFLAIVLNIFITNPFKSDFDTGGEQENKPIMDEEE